MHANARHAMNAYATIGVETGVMAADPHKLVLMLFEGARLAVAEAGRKLQSNETAAKGAAFSKAIMIIDSGLKASLDVEAGGDMAEKLYALYDYMTSRLLIANLHNDLKAVEEVDRLLDELQGAWKAIREPNISNAANIASATAASGRQSATPILCNVKA